MFFPFYGLSSEQVSKCLKLIDERKKEQEKKEQLKKLLSTDPPTSLFGMMAYSAALKNALEKK